MLDWFDWFKFKPFLLGALRFTHPTSAALSNLESWVAGCGLWVSGMSAAQVNCSASKEFAITTGLTRIRITALKMFVSIILVPRTK